MALYETSPRNLKPCKIEDRTLLEIGRLVRAVAEIEDIVSLFICALAEISESKMVILLGRTPLSRRLEAAKHLAKLLGPNVEDLHTKCFTKEFYDIIECRNALAHGTLLGINDEGRYAFLTGKTVEPDGQSAIQVVLNYRHEDIEVFAKSAESSIPRIENHLRVQALRQERLQRPLRRRPTTQPSRPPSVKRPSRPRPSRG